MSIHCWEGAVCFEGRGAAGFTLPPKVFRFVLAQGERLEMSSHAWLFVLQFY